MKFLILAIPNGARKAILEIFLISHDFRLNVNLV